jgi:hypothetical protein
VAAVMAGGYNEELAETVEIHLQTVTEARRHHEIWSGFPLESRAEPIHTDPFV